MPYTWDDDKKGRGEADRKKGKKGNPRKKSERAHEKKFPTMLWTN